MASATPISSSFSIKNPLLKSEHPPYTKHLSLSFTPLTPNPTHPLLLIHKFDRYTFITPLSSTSSSSDSYLNDPTSTGRFINPQDIQNLQILQDFRYSHKIKTGSLRVSVLRAEEIEIAVRLLAESFAESMLVPHSYVNLLGFLVKQYVMERRALRPHAATLVGFYEGEDGIEELAGTVEVAFDAIGANVSPPTPIPPKGYPYICNMAVKKALRRKGIGWHLLKASEELISQMTTLKDVYLHCRMIDMAPLNMYTKAGYTVIKTDNILTWLTLQRRKHLMRKTLPSLTDQSSDILVSGNNLIT
ncbi:GCN5-related N-acetyltransferase 5, chloroplastic-like [Tasmannia lanceolata]|uniref:GCN5-related N-acetyltransferase 5, chloroplastic-like n=1 Tax=Tasmannia lanceolata TaxID=3420 RepID=UPI0040647C4B